MASTAALSLLLILGLGGPSTFLQGVPPLPPDGKILALTPPQPILILQWYGTGEPDPASSNQAERLAAQKEVRIFKQKTRKALASLLKQLERKERVSLPLEALSFSEVLFSRPGCIFFGGFPHQGAAPSLEAGLAVNLGQQAAEGSRFMRILESRLQGGRGDRPGGEPAVEIIDGVTFRRLRALNPRTPIMWALTENFLLISVGRKTAGFMAGVLSGRLQGGNPELEKSFGRVAVERPSMRLYLDCQRLFEFFAGIRPGFANKLFDFLGLSSLKAVFCEAGLEGRGQVSRMLLETSGPPSGLLQLCAGTKPLTLQDLAAIPEEAAFACAVKIEPLELWRELCTFALTFDPLIGPDWETEAIEGFRKETGMHILNDIFRPLGDTILIWDTKLEGGAVPAGLTLAWSLDDAAKFKESARRLAQAIRKELRQNKSAFGRRRRAVRLEEVSIGDATLYFFNPVGLGSDMPVAPAFCVARNYLLVSLFPQAIKSFLARGETAEGLAAAKGIKLPEGTKGFFFCDTPFYARTLYGALLPAATVFLAEAQREGLELAAADLPSARALIPHLLEQTFFVQEVPAGLRITTQGQTGGIGLLLILLLGATFGA